MDVGELLRQARAQARLSQRDLARRARVSRTSIGAYETGALSPTVRQLDLLLEACGLGLHAVLRGRSVDLEAQVHELLTSSPEVESERLLHVADTFDRSGVTWAVDGPTALALQGLAVSGPVSYAVVLDDPLRLWIARHALRAVDHRGERSVLQGDAKAELITEALARGPAFGMMGVLSVALRVVAGLGDLVEVDLAGRPVPVVRWSDVLHAHPDRAEAVPAAIERRRS